MRAETEHNFDRCIRRWQRIQAIKPWIVVAVLLVVVTGGVAVGAYLGNTAAYRCLLEAKSPDEHVVIARYRELEDCERAAREVPCDFKCGYRCVRSW